jgi:hypothetical protein
VPFLLAGDVFERNKVEAIPSRRYDTGVGNGVEGCELRFRDATEERLNRRDINFTWIERGGLKLRRIKSEQLGQYDLPYFPFTRETLSSIWVCNN